MFPGDGVNQVYGGSGNDRITLLSACEVESGTILNGGSGHDTLESPLDFAQLAARGVLVSSIEEIMVVGDANCRGNGTCTVDSHGDAMCQCDPGWTGDFCQSCAPGFHFVGPDGVGSTLAMVLSQGDDEAVNYVADLRAAGVQCVPDESCATFDCGPRGHCVERNGVAACDCDIGWGGVDTCDRCIDPWQPAGTQCVLGSECDDNHCSGHGVCYSIDVFGSFDCLCDPGFSGPSCQIGVPSVTTDNSYLVAGQSATLTLGYVDDCENAPVAWSVGAGDPGHIVGAGSTVQLVVDPGEVAAGDVLLHTKVSAQYLSGPCSGDTIVDVDIPVGPDALPSIPVSGDHNGLRDLDKIVSKWMQKNSPLVPGASVAVNYNGSVVYSRAFGWARTGANAEKLQPWHRMRLASVSKPLTAALVRQLDRFDEVGEVSFNFKDSLIEVFRRGGQPWFDVLHIDEDLNLLQVIQNEDVQMIDRSTQEADYYDSVSHLPTFQRIKFQEELEARIADCFSGPQGENQIDPLWGEVTIEQLINHAAGLDRGIKPGRYNTKEVLDDGYLGHDVPILARDRTALSARYCLPYEPGGGGYLDTYSNLGYALLGELIRLSALDKFDIKDMEDIADFLVLDGIEGYQLSQTREPAPHRHESYSYTNERGRDRFEAECEPPTPPEQCLPGEWRFPGGQVSDAYGGSYTIEARVGDAGWSATACAVTEFQNRFSEFGEKRFPSTDESKKGGIWGTTTKAIWKPWRYWIEPFILRNHAYNVAVLINADDDRFAKDAELGDLIDDIEDYLEDLEGQQWPTKRVDSCRVDVVFAHNKL